MKKIFEITKMKKLSLAVAAAGMFGMSGANAVEFNFGELRAQIDNNISYGVSMRTEKPDAGQVMPQNGAQFGINGKGSSYNYDDGTLNYKRGDVYSNVLKWSGDLEIGYKNFGAFTRARAWYDQVIMDETPRFKEYNDATKSYAGKGAEILDAFVWGDFDVAGAPVNVRVGRQVLSWGESTFIQGGVGSVNPVDASAFRRPGAEIKEGLLPVNLAYTSIGLTANTTLEAFYQLQWEKTRTDPCGTFFSTIDFVADGCGPVLLTYTEAENEGQFPNTTIVERFEDGEPKDDGQFGVALRTYTDFFGGMELGLYYTNLHSRMPYINGKLLDNPYSPAVLGNHRMEYQIAYPEDIQTMGISMATSLPNGASLSAEISYRPDLPLQWSAFELIFAGVPYDAPDHSRFFQQRIKELGLTPADFKTGTLDQAKVDSLVGEVIDGFDKFDVWQAQTTYIQFFDRVFGADQLAVVAEAGVNYVPDLPNKSDARYGRSGAYGIGNTIGGQNACTSGSAAAGGVALRNLNQDYCSDEGYVTEWSGGVRLRAGLTYNNAFAGINVTPNINLAYDMGYAPEPGAQFIDKRFAYGLGVSFVYMNNATLDVTYAGFEGGDYDQMVDRDNISLAVKYSF